MKINCISCNKPHNQSPSRLKVGKGKFCSRLCYNNFIHLNNTSEKICKFCNKKFNIKLSQVIRSDRNGGIFCSKKCMDNSRKNQKSHICKKCKKIFNTVCSRKTALFCSRDCYIKDGGKRTSIEIIIEEILNKFNINFESQKSIKNNDIWTYVDFFIKPNICLYVDGDYWHSLPENLKRDNYNNNMLPKYDYVVLRISETNIKLGEENIISILKNNKIIPQ